jgi:hypothetical protein
MVVETVCAHVINTTNIHNHIHSFQDFSITSASNFYCVNSKGLNTRITKHLSHLQHGACKCFIGVEFAVMGSNSLHSATKENFAFYTPCPDMRKDLMIGWMNWQFNYKQVLIRHTRKPIT